VGTFRGSINLLGGGNCGTHGGKTEKGLLSAGDRPANWGTGGFRMRRANSLQKGWETEKSSLDVVQTVRETSRQRRENLRATSHGKLKKTRGTSTGPL